MRPAAMKAFAAFTKAHLREVIAIVINGKLITVPAIEDPITSGDLEISGNFKDLAEVEKIAAGLNRHWRSAVARPLALIGGLNLIHTLHLAARVSSGSLLAGRQAVSGAP
jgi:hypothetical protein